MLNRITGVIFSPENTMQEIEERPSIIAPLLMMFLFPLSFILLRFPLFKEYLRFTMEVGLAQSNLEMEPGQMDLALKVGSISGIVMTPVGNIVSWLIITAILFGAARLLKGKGSFKQYLAVTGFAFAIIILQHLMSFILSFSTGEIYADTSLALLAVNLKGSYLYGFLRGLDVFKIWYYIIIAIGISMVSKIDRWKILIIVTVIIISSALLGAKSAMLL